VEGNLMRWQHMTLSVLRGIGPASPVLFLEYERVTDDPVEQARRLASFLDAQCDRSTDTAVAQRMASACHPSLRRHRDGVRRDGAMTSPQRSLHRFLHAKVATPDLPFTDEFPMPPDWRARVMAEEAQ
jgi:Sulfotransferase domain